MQYNIALFNANFISIPIPSTKHPLLPHHPYARILCSCNRPNSRCESIIINIHYSPCDNINHNTNAGTAVRNILNQYTIMGQVVKPSQ